MAVATETTAAAGAAVLATHQQHGRECGSSSNTVAGAAVVLY